MTFPLVMQLLTVCTAVVAAILLPSPAAGGDPVVTIETQAATSTPLQVGVDIAPGLWLGMPGHGGAQCSETRYTTFPPQYGGVGIVDVYTADFGQPLTYRVTPGGSIVLSGDCVWSLIGA